MTTERTAEWAERAVADARTLTDEGQLSREQHVLARIDRARRRKPTVTDARITLAHGAGGKATKSLVEGLFLPTLRSPSLEPLDDAARLSVGGARLAFSTDTYVVSPLFFPGGDIGELAINGTVNDLAVSGARPLYLSVGFVLEEGFPVDELRRITTSMAAAAQRAGVEVVTGDTKVVPRGKADGCYINTAGVGLLDRSISLGADQIRPGDAILVSGPIGDHGVTILLARGELDIEADLTSDTAALQGVIATLLDTVPGVRMMRDATRGGVATVLNEMAQAGGVSVVVDEAAVPVRPTVTGACELLGIDPLYVACEGRFVAVVDGEQAETALDALRSHPLGAGATVMGWVREAPAGLVLIRTAFGGTRIVDMLVGDPLPRIC